MRRLAVIASIGAIVVAMLALFIVKYEVRDLERAFAALDLERQRHVEAIRVLRSEWSYLNRPTRIADLAERYLTLEPVRPWQVHRPQAKAGEAPAATALVDEGEAR